MSARHDVALVGAHLALQDICVCGHHRDKHAPGGDFCFACHGADDGRGVAQPCTRFVSVTAVVAVAVREHDQDLAAERRQALDRITENPKIRAALSTAAATVYDVVAELLREHAIALVAITEGHGQPLDIVEAAFAGWVIGFGVAHQDPSERSRRITELLAIARHAAEQSGAISAQIELRSLH